MPEDDGPLLEYDGEIDPTDPDDVDFLSSNDEWAYKQADRLVSRLPEKEGKDRKTEGEVFDRQTLLTLHKLLIHGALRSLDFPISTGKEANVFRGTTPMGSLVAVKIFRVNTATFKHVLKYIQGDERFEGAAGDKRDMVATWAQKEFRNMSRMRDAGVSVPEPIQFLNNVLIMEYIGVEEGPWPTLKELGRLDDAQPFWDALHEDFIHMVNDADLVHGDLSEYNVLVEDPEGKARPRVIDVGQAVLRSHPMSHEFLERDAKNLCAYFRRQGVREADPDQLLREVRK